MKWFLNLKIGLKLSLVITLVMLISFSFLGLYAYFTAQSLLTTNINMFYSSSAQEAAKQIRHILNIELTKIESIAARPEIKTMDWECSGECPQTRSRKNRFYEIEYNRS
jgi:hypothetical protein